jgi:hypothetical protein
VPSAPVRQAAALLLAAASLLAVSGCAVTSPAIITTPYPAADGGDASLALPDGSSIVLRNFVVVLGEAGGPGQVIGGVSYTGSKPQPLALTAADPTQVGPAPTPTASAEAAKPTPSPGPSTPPAAAPSVVLEVAPDTLTLVGPDGEAFVLPSVTLAPGQYLELTAASPNAGKVVWQVPIVAAEHYYASLAPSPSPSKTP